MGAPARFAFWIRAVEVSVLAVAICFSLGASDASSRFNDLGHRLMCTCGCNAATGRVQSRGLPGFGPRARELSAAIASGLSDQQILDAFAAKYGATVLAAPPTKGFDLVAWIAPFAVFAAALLGTILLIRRWGGLRGKTKAAIAGEAAAIDPEEQERMERIRRETGRRRILSDDGNRGIDCGSDASVCSLYLHLLAGERIRQPERKDAAGLFAGAQGAALREPARPELSNIAPANIPRRILSRSASFWNMRPHS